MRKVLKFPVLMLCVFLSACSNKSSDNLPLFEDLDFQLIKGENVVPIDSNIRNAYSELFNNSIIQVPLFKSVKHNDYTLFIGLPYKTNINALTHYKQQNSDSTAVFSSGDNFYFKKYTHDSLFIAEFAENTSNNHLVFVSIITKAKQTADSLFSQKQFSKRFNSTKK